VAIRFACPKCKSVIKANEDRAGTKIKCPKCGQALEVPRPREEVMMGQLLTPASGVSPSKLGRPATFQFLCPICQSAVQAPPGSHGSWTNCPRCQGAVHVPLPDGSYMLDPARFVEPAPAVPVPVHVQPPAPQPSPAPFTDMDEPEPPGSLDGMASHDYRHRGGRSYSPRNKLPASGLGLASVTIGLLTAVLFAIGIAYQIASASKLIVVKKANSEETAEKIRDAIEGRKTTKPAKDPREPQQFQVPAATVFYVGFGVCTGLVLSPLGLVLGLAALFQPDRRHAASAVGIFLNVLALAGLAYVHFA
jgi:Zn-finger nucleic acid-binding protein